MSEPIVEKSELEKNLTVIKTIVGLYSIPLPT